MYEFSGFPHSNARSSSEHSPLVRLTPRLYKASPHLQKGSKVKKSVGLLGVSALVGFGALLISSPAVAETGESGYYPEAGWVVRDVIYPTVQEGTDSEIVNADTVKLVRTAANEGTSAETTNLNLPVNNGDTVTVEYALDDDASFVSGAIRLFIYDAADKNTLDVVPTQKAVADAKNGTLTIDVNFNGTIGTAGLVYDESNPSTGVVTFTNLKVNDTKVLFKQPVVETPSPTPSETTASPTTEPTPTETPSETPSETPTTTSPQPTNTTTTTTSPSATVSTSPVAGGLPVTGESNGGRLIALMALGALAVAVGGTALVVSRKRRDNKFEAQ